MEIKEKIEQYLNEQNENTSELKHQIALLINMMQSGFEEYRTNIEMGLDEADMLVKNKVGTQFYKADKNIDNAISDFKKLLKMIK